jgi:hypothetical protein
MGLEDWPGLQLPFIERNALYTHHVTQLPKPAKILFCLTTSSNSLGKIGFTIQG